MRRLRVDQGTFDAVVKVVIGEYFESANGRLSNAKLSKIFTATNEAHQKRVSAGSKGGKAKAAKSNDKSSSNAKAKLKQPEPEPEPEPTVKRDNNVSLARPKRFQEFWDQFPHRGGAKKGKDKALTKYTIHIKANIQEADIIAGAQRYAFDRQVLDGYGKGPVPWLNGKCWNDEIEPQMNGTYNGKQSYNTTQPTGVDTDPAIKQITRLAKLR
jgi:hypothetical protein